jgi:hypothetical protein
MFLESFYQRLTNILQKDFQVEKSFSAIVASNRNGYVSDKRGTYHEPAGTPQIK